MVRARLLRALLLGFALLAGALAGLATAKAPSRNAGAAARHHRTTATSQTTTVTTTVSSTTTTTKTATARPKPKPKPKKQAKRRPAPASLVLSGWLGGASFPTRSLILVPPTSTSLTPAMVHVTENGVPVGSLTLTPLSRVAAGDFGAILVIAQGTTMNGVALQQAMAAARAIASRKSPGVSLGLITFAQNASVAAAPTTSQSALDSAFAVTPGAAPGSRVLPALSLAYQQLSQQNLLGGAVILVTDRAWAPAPNDRAPDAITDAAQRAGIQTYVIAVKDRGYTASTKTALSALDTPMTEASTSQLPGAVMQAWNGLAGGYLVTYRSHARPGRAVAVRASVDGVPGAVNASFSAPLPPPVRHHRASHGGARAIHRTGTPQLVLPAARPAAAGRSFWTSPQSLLIVGVCCALLIALAVGLLMSLYPTRRKVVGRVATFIPEPDSASAMPDGPDERARAPKLLARRRWWPGFVEQVEAAGLQRPARSLVKLALWGSLGVAIVIMFITGSPALALLGLPVGPLIMRAFVSRAARRQRDRFQQRLPSHLQDLAGAMRAGRSFVGAMSAVAEAADEPVKGQFEHALADERLGMPLEETLRAIARRMASEDMEQVALVAALNRRSGSNVAEALDRVAEGARERADLKRELDALTGQARISGRLLTALPPLMLVAVSVVSPRYAQPLFHTAAGIVVLCICAFMVFMGWMVIRRIVEVEV